VSRLLSNIGRRRHGNRLGVVFLVVAIGLFASGSLTIVRGLQEQQAVAETKDLGTIPSYKQHHAPGFYLPFASPLSISIPAIEVKSELTTVGKTNEGHIDAPKRPYFDNAAWYRDSPAPGQYGASVIVGHVDSYDNNNGASVFYSLAKLRPGDVIDVSRADASIASFKVYATRKFERQSIPDNQVYKANSGDAELRLITCAGTFDTVTAEYDSNTVIFAKLVSTRKSG
jgi:sortase (surface protein transpeptidase)